MLSIVFIVASLYVTSIAAYSFILALFINIILFFLMTTYKKITSKQTDPVSLPFSEKESLIALVLLAELALFYPLTVYVLTELKPDSTFPAFFIFLIPLISYIFALGSKIFGNIKTLVIPSFESRQRVRGSIKTTAIAGFLTLTLLGAIYYQFDLDGELAVNKMFNSVEIKKGKFASLTNNGKLYLKDFENNSRMTYRLGEGVIDFAFSPDGKKIVYAYPDSQKKLIILGLVDITSGNNKIIGVVATDETSSQSGQVIGATFPIKWAGDGKHIFFHGSNNQIIKMSLSGQKQVVKGFDGSFMSGAANKNGDSLSGYRVAGVNGNTFYNKHWSTEIGDLVAWGPEGETIYMIKQSGKAELSLALVGYPGGKITKQWSLNSHFADIGSITSLASNISGTKVIMTSNASQLLFDNSSEKFEKLKLPKDLNSENMFIESGNWLDNETIIIQSYFAGACWSDGETNEWIYNIRSKQWTELPQFRKYNFWTLEANNRDTIPL